MRKRIWRWFAALVGAVVLVFALYDLNQPLRTLYAPAGLLSLQTAPDPDAAADIIQSWDEKQRRTAIMHIALDFLLILAYAYGLRGALREASLVFSPGARRFVLRYIAPLQLWAGGCNFAEDLCKIAMIWAFGADHEEFTWLSLPTALFASLKWLFIAVGLGTGASGLLISVLRERPKFRPGSGAIGSSGRTGFGEALNAELNAIGQARGQLIPPANTAANEDVLHRADGARLVGLALSGGGIRSATVGLGVLQALADNLLLRRFDYLSTVSGGGYIGSWLSAWLQRSNRDLQQIEKGLRLRGSAAPQVEFLRTYSNYLTPHKGIFTVDTWAAVATYLRNLALNLTIFVLLVWAALALLMLLTVFGWRSPLPLGLAAVLLFGLATWVATLGVSVRVTELRYLRGFSRWAQTEHGVAFGVVGALFVAALAGGFWWMGWALDHFDDPIVQWWLYLLVAIGVASWFFASRQADAINREVPKKFPRAEIDAPGPPPSLRNSVYYLSVIVFSAAVAIVLVVVFWVAVNELAKFNWLLEKHTVRAAATMVMLPAIVLGGVAGGLVLGIGLLGTRLGDKGREWWSRIGGWLLAITLWWVGLAGGAFLVPGLVEWSSTRYSAWINWLIASTWGVLSGALARAGRSGSGDGLLAGGKRAFLTVGPYFAIAGFLIISTYGLFSLLSNASSVCQSLSVCIKSGIEQWISHGDKWPGILVLCLIAAMGLSTTVNINRFSLHDFYKNRLVRCYLGASNRCRPLQVDQVSGFAEKDDIRLAELGARPYHLLNVALNIVRGRRLAWQERLAASFTFSPLYCGFALPGSVAKDYRSTKKYAGGGVTLGTALSISGAAVSPQHGTGTTPVFMLFATLLNLRTGAWMPNSRYRVARPSPPLAAGYLMAELFGWTDESTQYVHLSDGGHFENLGIYELVRRRCALIVAIDAGHDPKRGFADLANCIRRCEVDFGARIVMDISNLAPGADGLSKTAWAKGTIEYVQLPHQTRVPTGTLLYVKSSLIDATSRAAQLYSYGHIDPRFPHHSTVDQWFDESRFESYRALGEALGESLIRQNLDLLRP